MQRKSRRRFLQESTAIGLSAAALPAERAIAANDKIRVACIGVRGRGNAVMKAFASEADCVVTHVCDVNESVRQRRAAEMKLRTEVAPNEVNDFRDLLSDDSIDAFMVATPDHWHALLTIHGCMAGKDVYVEKPASHNIAEGRRAVQFARKNRRMVQLGTQIRSAPFLEEAAEYVRSGGLGQVVFGRSWETDRARPVHLSADGDPPDGFDYEIWQGPAPQRTFNSSIVGGAWRWLFDYGTGDLGNDGVHRIDYCRYVMGLEEMPQSISCAGGRLFFDDDQQWPDTMMITYQYPRHVLQYEMRLWSRPRLHGLTEGAAIYGENGWMLLSNSSWTAYDPKGEVVRHGETSMAESTRRHVRNFLDAVRSRDRDSLNQEIHSGHVSSVMCHAGNIAWRTGKKLAFDAESETFDDPAANELVGREHRKGYELPEI